jgi:hypothetical protein
LGGQAGWSQSLLTRRCLSLCPPAPRVVLLLLLLFFDMDTVAAQAKCIVPPRAGETAAAVAVAAGSTPPVKRRRREEQALSDVSWSKVGWLVAMMPLWWVLMVRWVWYRNSDRAVHSPAQWRASHRQWSNGASMWHSGNPKRSCLRNRTLSDDNEYAPVRRSTAPATGSCSICLNKSALVCGTCGAVGRWLRG